MTPPVTTDDPEVIKAITGRRLATWAARGDSEISSAAMRTCTTIGTQVAADMAEIVSRLSDRGLDIEVDDAAERRQRHEFTLDVTSVEVALRVADALADEDFERWDRWSGAAERSFLRHAGQLTLARTQEHTLVIRVRWRRSPEVNRARALLRSLFRPTRGDWTMVSLPPPLWRLYSLVRPVRLVLERTGRRDRYASGLGPFLSTPRSLLDPLLELAGVGPDDTLLDVGCGDGRLVLAAAETIGCRAIGIEIDARLVERARVSAAESGLDGRVEVVCGDARDVDLTAITAVFMFLPVDAVTDLVGPTLERLARGATLIVHEQTALPQSMRPRPDSSHAVIAVDAVTVAHVWHRVAAPGST